MIVSEVIGGVSHTACGSAVEIAARGDAEDLRELLVLGDPALHLRGVPAVALQGAVDGADGLPEVAPLTMALWGVMVPGPFWVFQYHRPVFQATAASFCTSQGLLRRSMPSASPAAL